MHSENASLYERLGGESAVEAVVVRFYEKIMTDASLAPFFDDLDMDQQIRKQIAFLTYAFGGPTEYNARALRAAHAGPVARGLAEQHFGTVATLLEGTLSEVGVERALIDEVMSIVATTHDDVLNK